MCIFQTFHEELLGKPEMSSPPPWLSDRLQYPFSSPANSERTNSPLNFDFNRLSPHQELDTSTEHVRENTDDSTEHAQNVHITSDQLQKGLPLEHAQSITSSEHAQNALPVENVQKSLTKEHSTELTPVSQLTDSGKSKIDFENSLGSPLREYNVHKIQSQSRIETEFPANNSSPKMIHVGLIYHKTDIGATQLRVSKNPLSSLPTASEDTHQSNKGDDISENQGVVRKQHITVSPQSGVDVSPGQELLKLSDSFTEKYTVNRQDGLPQIQDRLYSDSSDSEGSDRSRPASKDYSVASTVSLNELLERELDEMETPQDEDFSVVHLDGFDLDPVNPEVGTVVEDIKNDIQGEDEKNNGASSVDTFSESESDSAGENDDELLNSVILHAMNHGSTAIEYQKTSSPVKSPKTSPNYEKVFLNDSVFLPPGGTITTESSVSKSEEKLEPAGEKDSSNIVGNGIEETKESNEREIKGSSEVVNGLEENRESNEGEIEVISQVKGIVESAKVASQRPNSLELKRKNPEVNSMNGYTVTVSSDSDTDTPTPTAAYGTVIQAASLSSCSSENLKSPTKTQSAEGKEEKSHTRSSDYVVCSVQTPSPRKEILDMFARATTSVLNEKGEFDKEALKILELGDTLENVNIEIHPKCSKVKHSDSQETLTGSLIRTKLSPDVMLSSCGSSCTPDSAMQHSFSSSSSSDHSLADKPSSKDDGYASNSTISVSLSDLQNEVTPRSEGQPDLTPRSEGQPDVTPRSEGHGWLFHPGMQLPDSALDICPKRGSFDDIQVNLVRRDSVCSVSSNSSIENSSIGRVRDIKAFFEGSKQDKKKKVPPPVAPKHTNSKYKSCVPMQIKPRTPDKDVRQHANTLCDNQVPDKPSSKDKQETIKQTSPKKSPKKIPDKDNAKKKNSSKPGTPKGSPSKPKVSSPRMSKPCSPSDLLPTSKKSNGSPQSDNEGMKCSPQVDSAKQESLMCVSDSCIFSTKYIKTHKLDSFQSKTKSLAQENRENYSLRTSSESAVEKYSKSRKNETFRKIKETLLHDWRKLKRQGANQKRHQPLPQTSVDRSSSPGSLLPRRSKTNQVFYRQRSVDSSSNVDDTKVKMT